MKSPLRWLDERGLERTPLAWIPFALAVLLGLPFLFIGLMVLAVIVPIFGVLQLIGFWQFSKTASRGHFHDGRLEITNEKGTLHHLLEWQDIRAVEKIFDPPLVFLRIRLESGEIIDLHKVDEERLQKELGRHGIPFDPAPRREP